MCFHSKQSKTAQKVENKFNAKFENVILFNPEEHYNGFEFPKTPVITNENITKIQMINWGLIPNWANKDWNKTYTLNARIETLKKKSSFKNILNNRCLILVNGFYEWKQEGNKKVKYEIGIDNNLFAFAGLFDENNGIKTYTIITTEAQGIMKEIHNTKLRMPVTLASEDSYTNWLEGREIEMFSDFTATRLQKPNNQISLF